MLRHDHVLTFRSLKDMPMDMYLSEKANLKPKEAHTIRTTLKKVAKMINAPKNVELPKVYIVSPSEANGAIASYRAFDDKLFIAQGVFVKQNDSSNDKENKVYAGDGYLGTAVHEMFHWKDAQEYVLLKGEITDQEKYLKYRIEQDRKMLEKLGIKEEQAKQISDYAVNCFTRERYDEVYAEYRTAKILKEV